MLTLPARFLADGDLAGGDAWGAPDGRVLGASLAILGLFLVANAILLRGPRSLIEERFGGRRLKLRSIREVVFQRVQMTLGFAFLIAGFAAQLYGVLNPPVANATPTSTSLWIGLVVFLGVAGELGAWWFALHSFRRQLHRWFVENPPEFETDMALAREVGEVFGVESTGEDTVESYCLRVRRAIGLPSKPTFPRGASRDYERAPDEGEEATH